MTVRPCHLLRLLLPPLVFLSSGSYAAVPVNTAGPADPTENLTPEETQEILQWISQEAADPGMVSQDRLNRAALRSLLQDLSPPSGPAAPVAAGLTPVSPPLSAPLGNQAAYIRPGMPDAPGIKALAGQLASLPEDISTVILDLRVPLPSTALAAAAPLSGLFLPEGIPLFQVRSARRPAETLTSSGSVRTGGRIWLLADETTPPVLELTGHLLVRHAGAVVFGTPAPGVLTELSERRAGSSGPVIRIASGAAAWPDGTALNGIPLMPHVRIPSRPDSRAALLSLTDPAALESLRHETDLPRFNEAALMSGESPEHTPAPRQLPALRPDPLLQQADDLLRTSSFLNLDAAEEIKRAEPPDRPDGDKAEKPD